MTLQHPLVARLFAYGEACNRFDMYEAVRFFATDASVEFSGLRLEGTDALVDLHEYDRGCGAKVSFHHVTVEESRINCLFLYETESDRTLGLPGLARWSTIDFDGALISHWSIAEPVPEDRARRHRKLAPFIVWAKEHHPERLTRIASGVNYDAGHAWTQLCRLWQARIGYADMIPSAVAR